MLLFYFVYQAHWRSSGSRHLGGEFCIRRRVHSMGRYDSGISQNIYAFNCYYRNACDIQLNGTVLIECAYPIKLN